MHSQDSMSCQTCRAKGQPDSEDAKQVSTATDLFIYWLSCQGRAPVVVVVVVRSSSWASIPASIMHHVLSVIFLLLLAISVHCPVILDGERTY
jgi:hypothetical protein